MWCSFMFLMHECGFYALILRVWYRAGVTNSVEKTGGMYGYRTDSGVIIRYTYHFHPLS
jgi:hypothetical protein